MATLKDRDVLGDKALVTHEEAVQFGQLTEEEKIIEKKLRRKIDSRIMPLVVLVYLMNYIDRYWPHPQHWYFCPRLTRLQQQLCSCQTPRSRC